MQTRLTLQMDDKLVALAKAHAKKRGKSVSQLVADYFKFLDRLEKSKQKPPLEKKYGPITESLKGALKGAKVDEEDYYRYLEKNIDKKWIQEEFRNDITRNGCSPTGWYICLRSRA